MKTLCIHAKNGEYNIYIGKDILTREYFSDIKKCVALTDGNVAALYGDYIDVVPNFIIRPGEQSKDFATLESILNYLLKNCFNRTDTLIAFGGGVVGDVGGFAAAVYKRGMNLIQIPTTLLAQVDSSVGGKTAVNLEYGKNMVGAFYQPKAVIIDTKFLETLDERIFASGMAEVIKYAFIADKDLYNQLTNKSLSIENIIYKCCAIKAGIVEEDPFDTGKRMILNYGHTIGHAIEAAVGYGTYYHGEAIAIGMMYAARLSEHLGICERNLLQKTRSILVEYGLPISITTNILQNVINIIKSDKKVSGGKVNTILLRDIGEPEIVPISVKEIQKILDEIHC